MVDNISPKNAARKKKRSFFKRLLKRTLTQRRGDKNGAIIRQRINFDINSRSNRWSVNDDKEHLQVPVQIQEKSEQLEQNARSPQSSDKSDSDEDVEVYEELPSLAQPLTPWGDLEVTVYQIDFTPPPLPTRGTKRRRSYLLRCSVGVEKKSEPINLHPDKGPQFPVKVVFQVSDITGQLKLRIWAKARRHDRCLGQVVVPFGFLTDMGGRSGKLWYQILPTPRNDRDGCYEASHPEVHGCGLERDNEKLGWVHLSVNLTMKHGIYVPYLLAPVYQTPKVHRDGRFIPGRFAKNVDRIRRYFDSSPIRKIFGMVVRWQSPGMSIMAFFLWSWLTLVIDVHWYPFCGWAWMVTAGLYFQSEEPPLDVWETQAASPEIGSLGHLAEVYKVAPQLQEMDEWIEFVATSVERFRLLFDWNTDERMSLIVCGFSMLLALIFSLFILIFGRFQMSFRVVVWLIGVFSICPLWHTKGHLVNRWILQLVKSTSLRYAYFMVHNIIQRSMDIKKYEHFKILEKTRRKQAPQWRLDTKKESTAKYHKSSITVHRRTSL